MLTHDQINVLRDKVSQLTDPVTDYLLRDIAERIAEVGQLTGTAAYQIWRMQQLGVSQREVKRRLKKLLNVSNQELRRLLTQSAEVGYTFDISHLPQVQAIPFHQNTVLQQMVSAAVELAQQDFTNLTQTLGMVDPFGNALPLQEAYRSCTDFAFQQVITGAADYNTAIRQATRNLAEKGVRVIDYESGLHTSLEAAVRRNIMGGLGLMQEQITQHVHDTTGCDGWEISAHAYSAPDHEPIQGKQYSDAAYTQLNNALRRRIGTLNCGHAAFPILLGISEPQYTDAQLRQLRTDNETGVTVDGRHYTGYEATQQQRKLERAIRRQKRRVLVAEAAGDTKTLSAAQTRLRLLRQDYKHFSKAAGLRTQHERVDVAGGGKTIPPTGNKINSANAGIEELKWIGAIDFSDKDTIVARLAQVEEKLYSLEYEVNITITSDGKVWQVLGDSSTVNPATIPSSLIGSYSYHNHPQNQTHYSFSAEDAAFFIESGESYSKASDNLYEYVMQRTKKTVAKTYEEVYHRFKEIERTDIMKMKWDGMIDADFDEYHETMKQLSRELNFTYERKKKSK